MSFADLKNSGRRIVAPLAGFPAVRLTGTTIKENLSDPHIQAKSLLELYKRARPDILFHMMDLTVEAEALGADIRMPPDDNPAITSHLVQSLDDAMRLKKLSSPSGRMGAFTETVRLLKKGGVPVAGAYVIGPFTLASELIGAEDAALMTITDPDIVKATLDAVVQTIIVYAKSLADAGADVVAILEPDAMFLSPAKFDQFVSPYVKRVIKAIARPAVLHICGDSAHLVKSMCATGAAGLSLDSDVDLFWAINQTPSEVFIIGNIAPSLMLEGRVDEIKAACAGLLRKMEPFPNYIISSGCDLPVDTPIENIITMVKSAAGK